MNTDRELLELAAKAAGIVDAEWSDTATVGPAIWSATLFDEEGSGYWNPLTDAAEALRLAVDFRMTIHFPSDDFDGRGTKTVEVHYNHDGDVCRCATFDLADDPRANVRRAIVHAAADIGRAK